MYRHGLRYEDAFSDNHVVQAHNLCRYCARIGSDSKIIQDVPHKYTILPNGAGKRATGYLSDEDAREIFPHSTITEIETSLMDGCHLCMLIYHRLSPEEVEDLRRSQDSIPETVLNIAVEARESSHECGLRLLRPGKEHGPRIPLYAERGPRFTDSDERLPPTRIQNVGQLAISTDSSASFELPRRWLSACRRDHIRCNDMSKVLRARMPARVIDVSVKPPRLRLTNKGDFAQGPYLTLSHCWGNMAFTTLKVENVDRFQKSLPDSALSRTFTDALFITSQLGYQYIWIDSLCIIQDSKEDWRAESARMADIYGGSDCTIAAIGQDGRSGCFKRRNPLLRRPCRIARLGPWTIFAYGFTIDARNDFPFLEDSTDLGGLDNSPLLQRGWVVQERLLSSRIVYYGANGLVWECCEQVASDFWPEGVPSLHRGHDSLTLKQTFSIIGLGYSSLVDSKENPSQGTSEELEHGSVFSTRSNNSPQDSPSYPFIKFGWNQVLETYTRSKLTFASDRAVALAGMLTFLESGTQLKWIYGVWEEFLPFNLLWSALRPLTGFNPSGGSALATLILHERQLEGQYFPSWSWLPVHGPITAHTVRYSSPGKADSLTYEAVYTPNDEAAGRRWLNLTGLLKKMEFPLDEKTGKQIVGPRMRGNRWSTGYPFINDVEIVAGMDIHFFLVRRVRCQVEKFPARSATPKEETEIVEEGLVLIPYRDDAPDGWIRIGYFSNIHQMSWPNETNEILYSSDESVAIKLF